MVESLLEIITEKKSQKFYKPIDVHSMANAIEKVEVSMVKFVVIFFCGQIVNKQKGWELFLDRMN